MDNSFAFRLESATQAKYVLSAKKKLKGTSIFVNKDYTAAEQKTRYQLRTVQKVLRQTPNNLKIRLGDLCIYINDKKFVWSEDGLISFKKHDVDFLNDVLNRCGANYKAILKTPDHRNVHSDELSSSEMA